MSIDILTKAKSLDADLAEAKQAKQLAVAFTLECMIECVTEQHKISRCESCQQLNEDCNLIDGECSNCDTETHLRAAYEQKLEDSRNDF